MKLSIKVLLGLLVFVLPASFYKKATDGFTIASIRSSRPFSPSWQGHLLSEQEKRTLQEAIGQSYHYFGCGGQSFIFFSQDGKYVIKFFKQRVFREPTWFAWTPIPFVLDRYKEKKRMKRIDKLERDFGSYVFAFDELQEFTGVTYIHLNQTSDLHTELPIVDRLGITHMLDLDQFDFIIQKKAELVYDRVNESMAAGRESAAQETISQVLRFIVERCQRGFHDRDPNIRTNCGFIDGKAVKIDVGRFVKSTESRKPEFYHRELLRISAPFQEWILQKHPSLAGHFQNELQLLLNEPAPLYPLSQ